MIDTTDIERAKLGQLPTQPTTSGQLTPAQQIAQGYKFNIYNGQSLGGSTPAMPTASSYTSPAPSSGGQLTPEQQLAQGYTYNIYTGQLLSSGGNNTQSQNTASTATPFAAGGQPAPAATDNETLTNLLSKYQEALKPTTAMLDLQKKATELEAARRTANTDVEGQGINVGAKTGYEALIDKQSLDKENAIQAQYGIAEGQQKAGATAAEAALELAKPTTLGVGTNLVNGLTGATIASGQSYSGKTDYSTVAALMKSYPDANILPTDSPDVAADKVSNAPSFYSKNTSTVMKFDPATGTFITYNSKSLPGSSASSFGTSSGGGSGGGSTSFGTSSSISSAGGSSLQQGSSGGSVQALQQFLVSQGYMTQADMNTGAGTFGPKTAAAVAAFQKANGVDTSGGGVGVFGPKTQAAAAAKGLSLSGTMTSGSGSSAPVSSAGAPRSGVTLNPANKIDSATLSYMQTGEMPSGLYPADQNAVRSRALAVNPNFNPAIAKANVGALKDQTSALATIQASINTADSNFKLLIDTATAAGINDKSAPVINGIKNAITNKYIGSGSLNQFNTGIQTLRTEYASVLARGGEVTDSIRNEANSLIPDDISLANLQMVYDYIKKEGQNVIKSRQDQINILSGGSPSSSGSSGGNNPFGI